MRNLMHVSTSYIVLIFTVCMHDACIIVSNTTSVIMQSLASMFVCGAWLPLHANKMGANHPWLYCAG
jgi:hypothetical protein